MGALVEGTHKGCPYETFWLRLAGVWGVVHRTGIGKAGGPGLGIRGSTKHHALFSRQFSQRLIKRDQS